MIVLRKIKQFERISLKENNMQFRKIFRYRWILKSILTTIYFNFHYLPFRQAVKLPILLNKPKLKCCKGKVIINSPFIKFGMIHLGEYGVGIYPDTGIIWENNGVCIFNGRCYIGSGSAISVGEPGQVVFGNNFIATALFKLASWCKIEFKDDVLVGWDCLFIDTDFHTVIDIANQTEMIPSLPIFIGEGCWFANKCTILKNTNISDKCIIASNSLLNKAYKVPSNSLLAGIPATLKKTGVYYHREL